MSIAEQILAEAARSPEGWPLQAKTLLHLGERAAIYQALSRLNQTGDLLKISRGSYVRVVEGRFGLRRPALARVVEGWATATSEIITADGAKAANALGLSTQVPVRPVYLTSGRTLTLPLRKQKIELRHAPDWQHLLLGRLAGDAVRALSWLGPRVSAKAIA